jgi:ATP-binding cassette subfamily B protein
LNDQNIDTPGLEIKRLLRLDRALRFVWQAGPGWTISNLALVILQGTLPLLTLYLMKLIVDEVVLAMGAADKAAVFQDVGVFIILAGAVALLNALLQLIGSYIKEAHSLKVTDHMYDILHTKSMEVDLAYYENPHYLDTLHRAQKEGPYRPTHILDGLMQIGQNGVSLLAMAGLLFSFHWGIALVLFAAAIPGVLVRLKYSKKMFDWQRRKTPSERRAAYYNWMLTGYEHAKEIRLFGLGNLFTKRFHGLRNELRRGRLEIAGRRSAADLVAQAGGILAIFGALGFIAYRTVTSTITIGDMVMYFQAFQRGLGFLRQVLGGMAGLYEDNLFLSNLFEFLDLKPKVKEPANPQPVPRPLQQGIAFDRVSFHYPTGKREVLKEISFTIKPGEVVALVGANGSGKTTLIKLLCRLYDPAAGTITFDGIDLRRFDTRALRHEISVIFQDFVQYHLTARENIWFGNTNLPPEHENIEAAARHSETHDLISGLPRGYETILGKWFEDGEELSIGEWQKVALARAFLRESQIIVLDEPTSAMDAKSEYEVFSRIRRLLKGRTAILISHRFSTVRMADRIFTFENGCISESGTHEQLLQNGGKYAYLFEKQARHYR